MIHMHANIICGIYCIENLINHKKYIGQSVNILDRWSKHQNELKHGNHDNDYLQKSWNKYGVDNFDFYILECCKKEQLDERETYYIDFYNTMNRDLGYNLKSGGQFHNYVCDEVRQKISDAQRRVYENTNLKQVRSENALKQWANPENKAKIMGENNGMYGRKHSEEAKKKMSEAAKNRYSHTRNRTPVYCVELDREFEDATEAANELGCQGGTILRTCRGLSKTCCGYHWQFLQPEIPSPLSKSTKQNNLKE